MKLVWHKKNILIILVPLLCLVSSLAAQTERGFQPVRLPTTGEAYYPYKNRWAVLIGINKFKNVPELKYAVQDAEGIKQLLIVDFGFQEDHIIMLLDDDANLNRIRSVLGDELTKKVQPNDQVLVFWAGHGQTYKLPSGGDMGYLIPVEGDPKRYYSSCISMKEIRTIAELMPAKHVLFLVDACYSGLAADQKRGMPPETADYLRKITKAKGRQIITAGEKGEEVIESSDWGHSAFTYQLLLGLRNKVADEDADGVITSTELATYLKSRVTRLSGFRQTPQYRILDGDGEFVFITDRAYEENSTSVGTIHVRTKPWCEVFLDGKKVCTTPSMIKNVSPGDHQMILRRDGYHDIAKDIHISATSPFIRISEILIKE